MYNAKYMVDFGFKELTYKNVENIAIVVDTSDSFKVNRITTVTRIKNNKVVHLDERDFKKLKDLLEYLNSNVKYLNALEFVFLDNKENEVWLKYNDIYNRWELTYNKKTMEIDGFISNLRPIFKKNLSDFYRQYKYIIFWIIWGIQVLIGTVLKIGGIISVILNILLIFSTILILLKRKPYRNHKFINKNRDEIILNIFFYILGIITSFLPNIIKFFLK